MREGPRIRSDEEVARGKQEHAEKAQQGMEALNGYFEEFIQRIEQTNSLDDNHKKVVIGDLIKMQQAYDTPKWFGYPLNVEDIDASKERARKEFVGYGHESKKDIYGRSV